MVDKPPSSLSSTPSSLSPTQATAWVIIRQILLAVAATSLGAKFLPPDVLQWLLSNPVLVIAGITGGASWLYGIYRSFRGPTITSAAALPGAVVALDSQSEADQHKTDSVVGPKDPLPISPKP